MGERVGTCQLSGEASRHVSHAWESMWGHVNFTGRAGRDLSTGWVVWMDVSNGWGSLHSHDKWVGSLYGHINSVAQ